MNMGRSGGLTGGATRPRFTGVAAQLLLTILTGCGARSEVPAPCIVPLHRAMPVAMVVFERSNLMQHLDGVNYVMRTGPAPPPDRHVDLALRAVHVGLPRIADYASVGLVVSAPVSAEFCDDGSPPPFLPGAGTVPSILQYLDLEASADGAGAPLFDGAQKAALAFESATSARFIVLVTTGQSFCNFDIPEQDCDCSASFGNNDPCYGSTSPYPSWASVICDDRRRASALLDQLTAQGVRTIVLGVPPRWEDPGWPSTSARSLHAALNAFAIAGGVPRADADRRYYDARDPDEVTAALDATIGAAAFCRLRAETRAVPHDRLQLRGPVTGTIPRDPTRRNGWDWIDASEDVLEVFGTSCQQLVARPDALYLSSTGPCGSQP